MYVWGKNLLSIWKKREEIRDDDSTFESCTTNSPARSSLDILRNFIQGCDGITEQEFSAMRLIHNLIDKNYYFHKVQTKITDFFKK